MGPVISARHRERVMGYVEQGVAEGVSLGVHREDLPLWLEGLR